MFTSPRLRGSSLAPVLLSAVVMALPSRSFAADFFWVGGTGEWDNNPANWSDTVGGTGGFGVPGAADNGRLIYTGSPDIVVTSQGNTPAVSFIPIDATGAGLITFELIQGNLVADDEQSARDGRAVFNHSGGTNTVSNVLLMGRNPGSNGEYNFSGGGVTSFGLVPGFGGTGIFNHTGGTNTVTGSLQIAGQATGTGTYNLSGAGSSLTTREAFVGAFGNGTFVQTGGTHTVDNAIGGGGTGALTLAFDAASQGTYELSGGTLQVKGNEFIGGVGQGTFTQTGGTHTIGSITGGTGDLSLSFAHQFGQNPSRFGVFNLDGGTLNVGDDAFIGVDGPGTFNQTQGTNTIANRLVLGSRTLASMAGTPADVIGTGEYNLSGGDLSSASVEIGEFGAGTFNQTGGTHSVINQLIIGKESGSTGAYNLSNGTLSANAIVIGSLGTGTFNLSGGTLTTDSLNIINPNGAFSFTGGVLHATNITGNIVNHGGTIAPGQSPGTTHIDGGYTQTAIGETQIEIAGTNPGVDFDQLTVTQSVSLAGTLDVSLLSGFAPTYGQQFSVLTYGSRTGTFSQVNGTFLTSTRALAPVYDFADNPDTPFNAAPNSLTLFVTAPGDTNLDLIVDFTDLAFLASGFNKPGTWQNGDFNGDGIVDFTDLAFLASNFNKDFNPLIGTSFDAATTIPEPGTVGLVVIGGVLIIGRRKRSR